MVLANYAPLWLPFAVILQLWLPFALESTLIAAPIESD